MQRNDDFCKQKLVDVQHPFTLEDGVLHRVVKEGRYRYHAIVVPEVMKKDILRAAHDEMGHNGFSRCYSLLKRLYYWKRMKRDLEKHIRNCAPCLQQNRQVVKYQKLQFKVPNLPMQFISMDLIGPFPETIKGNKYALTAIDMLTVLLCCTN